MKRYGALFYALVVLVLCAGCGQRGPRETTAPGAEKSTMTPAIPKEVTNMGDTNVVMIIASNQFRDEELFKTKEVLQNAGINVTVASSSLETAKGMLGGTAKPDILLGDINVDEYDAVIFVGGQGASEYWDSAQAHQIALDAHEKGKIVAAICIAPVTLAKAGLLEGKKATVWESEKGKLKAAGCNYTGTPIAVDGNIITANGPTSAEPFGQAIVKALSND